MQSFARSLLVHSSRCEGAIFHHPHLILLVMFFLPLISMHTIHSAAVYLFHG